MLKYPPFIRFALCHDVDRQFLHLIGRFIIIPLLFLDSSHIIENYSRASNRCILRQARRVRENRRGGSLEHHANAGEGKELPAHHAARAAHLHAVAAGRQSGLDLQGVIPPLIGLEIPDRFLPRGNRLKALF